MCLQEIKTKNVSKKVSWKQSPTNQFVGGLLSLLEEGKFDAIDRITGNDFFLIQGKWNGGGEIINIINIYSPCALNEKVIFWEEILQLKKRMGEGAWCVISVFNVIRRSK